MREHDDPQDRSVSDPDPETSTPRSNRAAILVAVICVGLLVVIILAQVLTGH